VPRLRDIVGPEVRVLFVGINPSLRSAAVGHHFAGPGNPFWRLLHAARLVPEPLTHVQDRRLGDYGLALTNLCPRPTRAASELGAAEIAAGRRTLQRKVRSLRPRVVVFVGLGLYQAFFGLPASNGPGPKPERISGAEVFVVPNPSGLNASFPGFQHKLVWFEALAGFLASRP
jgi:TDG/mug DNA glycosylase family protein